MNRAVSSLHAGLFAVTMVRVLWTPSVAVTRDNFYPLQGGHTLPCGDDKTSPKITVHPPFFFFGNVYSSLYVSSRIEQVIRLYRLCKA